MVTKRKFLCISAAVSLGCLICYLACRYASTALMYYRIHRYFNDIHPVPQLNVETDVCKEDGLEFHWCEIKGASLPVPNGATEVKEPEEDGDEEEGDEDDFDVSPKESVDVEYYDEQVVTYNLGDNRLEYRFYGGETNNVEVFARYIDALNVDVNDYSWSMPKAQFKEWCARFANRVMMGTSPLAYLDVEFCEWKIVLSERTVKIGMFYNMGIVGPGGDLLCVMLSSTTDRSDETRKRYDRGFLLEIAERYIRNRQEVGKVSQ